MEETSASDVASLVTGQIHAERTMNASNAADLDIGQEIVVDMTLIRILLIIDY